MNDNTILALCLLFKEHENSPMEYLKTIVDKILNNEAVDIRDQGFRCNRCGKIGKEVAFPKKNVVRFNNNEIYICNDHYDGCNGWD